MTEGSKHTTGFAFHILQASLGGANPVFFLLESAKHLSKRARPLDVCGAVRALRPVVIARNVSKCSMNPRGLEIIAASASVLRTVAQNGAIPTIDY